MIDSDDLGHIGETKFQALCAEVGLICNPSHRDRAGWDFVVDFPQKTNVLQSFDKRPAPISCVIQVKSINSGQRSISMRLTAAELLAKAPKPAFVYVPTINKNRSITKSHLLHIHGERLSSILKRLRKEAFDGNKNINRKFISFTIAEDEAIEVTSVALREAVEVYIQDGMDAYIRGKQDWLEKAGYDGVVASIKTTIRATPSQMVDLLLGLETRLPAYDTKLFDRRFDISIQDEHIPECFISISPEPIDSCRLIVTEPVSGRSVSLRCDVFKPPILDLPPELAKTRLRGKLFEMQITASEINFSARWGDGLQASLDDWRKLALFCTYAETPGCMFEIRSDGGGVDWKARPKQNRVTLDGYHPSKLIEPIDDIFTVLQAADICDGFECDIAWIDMVGNHARMISKALRHIPQDFSLSGNISNDAFVSMNGRGVFSATLGIPNGVLIYAGVGDFSAKHDGRRGTISTKDLRVTQVRSYRSYDKDVHQRFSDEIFQNSSAGFCVNILPEGSASLRARIE